MKLLKKKDLIELFKKKGQVSVSMFIPTHRDGSEINRIQFSSILKELKIKLSKILDEKQCKKFLRPFKELEKNSSFWKYQSDGLAVYATEDHFETLALPINFEPFLYISDHFYVKSILPVLNEDEDFYMLIANKEKLQPFLCSRYWIEEIDIQDEIANIGSYNEFKITSSKGAFQGHSTGSGNMVHKQNSKSDKSTRALDNYVNEWLKAIETKIDLNIPVLLVADDRMVSVIRNNKNKIKYFEDEIRGNYKKKNILLIHEMAVEKLKHYFKKEKVDFIKDNSNKKESELLEIYKATREGRVSELGVQNMKNEMVENEKNNSKAVYDFCMLNLSVINTIKNGGNAYLINKEFQDAEIAAIYRY